METEGAAIIDTDTTANPMKTVDATAELTLHGEPAFLAALSSPPRAHLSSQTRDALFSSIYF